MRKEETPDERESGGNPPFTFINKTEEFLAFLCGALLAYVNDGTPLYLQKSLHIQNALAKFGALCFFDEKMRREWPKMSCPETFFRSFPEGRLSDIFADMRWEKSHASKIWEQKWMKDPEIPLWYLEGGKLEVEDSFLSELFPNVKHAYFSKGALSDIAQARVYYLLRDLGQEGYVKGRRFLIENPVLMEPAQAIAMNRDLEAIIDASYEPEKGGLICPDCGWLVTCETRFCPVCGSSLKGASEKAREMSRLRFGVMRFIAKPGRLEMEIAHLLNKLHVPFQWWPDKDKYDFRAQPERGPALCLDAKDFCANPDKSVWAAAWKMKKLEASGTKAIVIRNRIVPRIVRRLVEVQSGVKVLTLKDLEDTLAKRSL